jgi:hypothetical protein
VGSSTSPMPFGFAVVSAYAITFCAVSHFLGSAALIIAALLGIIQGYLTWCGCEARMQREIDQLRCDLVKHAPDFVANQIMEAMQTNAKNQIASCLRESKRKDDKPDAAR